MVGAPPHAAGIADIVSDVEGNSSGAPARLSGLTLENVDEIADNTYVIKFSPPKNSHIARLFNFTEAPLRISLVGFPDQFFYTPIGHELSQIEAEKHADFRIVMMYGDPGRAEFPFEIRDTAGDILHVRIHLEGEWKDRLKQKLAGFQRKISALKTQEGIYNRLLKKPPIFP